jgi:hypothetical protein
VVNTDAAVEGINALLKNTGFQGFSFEKKRIFQTSMKLSVPKLVRLLKISAKGTQLYSLPVFPSACTRSEDADSVAKDKIVVIDDLFPVWTVLLYCGRCPGS